MVTLPSPSTAAAATSSDPLASAKRSNEMIQPNAPLVEVYFFPKRPKNLSPSLQSMNKDECFRMLTDFRPCLNLTQLKDEAMTMALDFFPNTFEELQSHFKHTLILVKQKTHLYSTTGSVLLHALVENNDNIEVYFFPNDPHQTLESKAKSVQQQKENRVVSVKEKATSPIPSTFLKEVICSADVPLNKKEDLGEIQSVKKQTTPSKKKSPPTTNSSTTKASTFKTKTSSHSSPSETLVQKGPSTSIPPFSDTSSLPSSSDDVTTPTVDLPESNSSPHAEVSMVSVPSSAEEDKKMVAEMSRRKKSKRAAVKPIPIPTPSETSSPTATVLQCSENPECVEKVKSKEISESDVHTSTLKPYTTPPSSLALPETLPSKEESHFELPPLSHPPLTTSKHMDIVPTPVTTPVRSSLMEEKKDPETTLKPEPVKKRTIDDVIDELQKTTKKTKKGSKHDDGVKAKKSATTKNQAIKAEEKIMKGECEIVNNEKPKTQVNNVVVDVNSLPKTKTKAPTTAAATTTTTTTKRDMVMKEIEKVFDFEPTLMKSSATPPSIPSVPSTTTTTSTSKSLTPSQLSLIDQMTLPVNPKTLVGGRNRGGRL